MEEWLVVLPLLAFWNTSLKDLKWAHLDIAGTAWKSNNKKATGRPIPLLMNFVLNEANDSN